MPIKIPEDLPASDILAKEGVLLIKENDAIRQDVRPMRIALLNLMPKKIETETQIVRVLAGTPLQVEMTLVAPTGYQPKNTPREHMLDFYKEFETIRDEKFDGLIITGAPIEQMPFEEVVYWEELKTIFDWSRKNVHGLFNLCWGAQAALYHFYGIPKYQLDTKRFGVFPHKVMTNRSLMVRGLNDVISVPVSRHTENRRSDFLPYPHLEVLIESDEAGMCVVTDPKLRHVHNFNHLEYDSDTIHHEYKRDLTTSAPIEPPKYYYPDGDTGSPPINTWRGSGHLLFSNWLNWIYQTTPFDIQKIGAES
jgi:homoserine O-succinyltransferase/O-acetyltransferase